MNMSKVREYEGHTDLIEVQSGGSVEEEGSRDLSRGIVAFCFTVGAIVVGIGLLAF